MAGPPQMLTRYGASARGARPAAATTASWRTPPDPQPPLPATPTRTADPKGKRATARDSPPPHRAGHHTAPNPRPTAPAEYLPGRLPTGVATGGAQTIYSGDAVGSHGDPEQSTTAPVPASWHSLSRSAIIRPAPTR